MQHIFLGRMPSRASALLQRTQKNRPKPVFSRLNVGQNEAFANPSRYRSTSSAAMQPAPAEVMA